MSTLLTADPIHFYESLILFEDELGDNGTAIADVRVVLIR